MRFRRTRFKRRLKRRTARKGIRRRGRAGRLRIGFRM